MHCIYLLKSKKDDRFYVGFTSDLNRRYREHQNGKVKSTKNRRPLELIYCEFYKEEYLAREREVNLKKSGSAYNALMKRLKYK
jgi:putative endonuclease